VKFYNLVTLNPNLKTKISPNIFLGTSVYVFQHFQQFLLCFTGIYNYVTGSDDLNSPFHVEMNIRNSKIQQECCRKITSYNSLVLSLRGRVGRNQSPVL